MRIWCLRPPGPVIRVSHDILDYFRRTRSNCLAGGALAKFRICPGNIDTFEIPVLEARLCGRANTFGGILHRKSNPRKSIFSDPND